MKIGKINRQSIAISSFTSVLERYEGMPSELFVAGKLPTSEAASSPSAHPPAVAIIGSRRPTPYGLEVTRWFATELANRGVVIISGLAFGVDKAAHQACLDAGGTTVAVMAGGLHEIYPRSHTGLAEQIIKQGGALISEQPLGFEPHGYHFLARNRLVSGLADAVLVTEATDCSGTFSTVAHALTQNKDVFAVPGPITSLLSAGPNRLLQTGAQVACNPEDILRVVMPALFTHHGTSKSKKNGSRDTPMPNLRLPLGDSPLEVHIIKALAQGVTDGDALQTSVDVPTSEFLQTLTLMELKGSVQAAGGNRWQLGMDIVAK